MKTRQKVLIIGSSLILSGIEAGLRASPSFEVISVTQAVNLDEALAFNPGVVIFELGAVEHEFLIAQMQALPGLLMIGIDSETHEVLLTGQAARTISLDGITRLVASRESVNSKQ